MKDFFEQIERKVYDAVKKAMGCILEEVGNENVYAAALVTDEDCVSLFLAVNTYEYMRKKDLENLEFMRQYLSEDKIRKIEDGTDSLTKWTPSEWGYSDGTQSDLVEVSKMLFAKEQENSTEYEANKPLFFDAVTSALKRIVEEQVLDRDTGEITYFISLSDGDGIDEIENASAKLLNSESVYEMFLHLYDGSEF